MSKDNNNTEQGQTESGHTYSLNMNIHRESAAGTQGVVIEPTQKKEISIPKSDTERGHFSAGYFNMASLAALGILPARLLAPLLQSTFNPLCFIINFFRPWILPAFVLGLIAVAVGFATEHWWPDLASRWKGGLKGMFIGGIILAIASSSTMLPDVLTQMGVDVSLFPNDCSAS